MTVVETIGRAVARTLGLLLTLIAVGASVEASQGEPSISARLQTGVLKLGERTALVVTLQNAASGQIVELPETDGLRFRSVQGPSRRSYTTIVGGRRRDELSVSWVIEIEGLAEGDFEVPSVAIESGGKRYRTAPQPITIQADLLGEELGFIELTGLPERAVEGLPIELTLTFGWDRAIANETNFANLSLPWWENVDGALMKTLPVRGARREVEVQLNRQSYLAVGEVDDVERDGRVFRTFRVAVELTPVRSGDLSLPTSFLQFGTAQSDFFGRESVSRSYFSRAEAVEFTAEPLPTTGQPTDFGRAVGAFDVRAVADIRDVRVGDSIKLTVDWTGVGNFTYFEPPDPSLQPAFSGFRYFGLTEEKLPGRRRVTYDLAPLDTSVREIPPLELPYFDVEAWEYRRLPTESIPIRVRALEGEAGLEVEERWAEDLADIRTRILVPAGTESSSPSTRTLTGALFGILLGWTALRAAIRQGGRDPASVVEQRRRRALRRLERELRTSLDPETDLLAFAGFLAARAGEETEAWVGRDPRDHFGEAGDKPLPPDTVEALLRLNEDLEAAVYGDGERVSRGAITAAARDLLEDGL